MEEEINNISDDHIDEVLSFSEDQLYIALSYSVPIYENGMLVNQTAQLALSRGREIFNKYREKLKRKICVDWDYCNNPNKRHLEDIRSLMLLIAPVIFTTDPIVVPVLLIIAGILLRIGLGNLCECPD